MRSLNGVCAASYNGFSHENELKHPFQGKGYSEFANTLLEKLLSARESLPAKKKTKQQYKLLHVSFGRVNNHIPQQCQNIAYSFFLMLFINPGRLVLLFGSFKNYVLSLSKKVSAGSVFSCGMSIKEKCLFNSVIFN